MVKVEEVKRRPTVDFTDVDYSQIELLIFHKYVCPHWYQKIQKVLFKVLYKLGLRKYLFRKLYGGWGSGTI